MQYFAKELPALAAPRSASQGGAQDSTAEAQQPTSSGRTVQAMGLMLVQCLGAESPALLPSLLFLHCLGQVFSCKDTSKTRCQSTIREHASLLL